MAAMITTLAEHSYAYESAIILHHQPSGRNIGNIAEQKKGVEMLNEWAERLLHPVANKMGISLEDFYKRMYQESIQLPLSGMALVLDCGWIKSLGL